MSAAPNPTGRAVAGSVLGAAALITALTVLARLAGFARTLVLGRSVGVTALSSIYQTMNTVPNIMYEVVAGGALASLVVPLLARAVADDDRLHVEQTASALLTWTVLVLTPLAAAIALAAGPITRLLLGADASSAALDVGTSMLRVFAPQVALYGIGIVVTGILQAYRRFGGPALAPLLSSLVVIAAYLAYGLLPSSGTALADLTKTQELVLSVGTTLGVAVLSLSLLVPLSRLGLRLRPRLDFPHGVAGRARSLAYAGMAALVAQQLSVAVVLVLSNRAGAVTLLLYTQAQTLYLLPWAVLAVPVATTVFPRLAERWSAGDRVAYRGQLAASTTVVVLLSTGAAAVMAATARPLARVMVQGAPGAGSADGVEQLTRGVTGFAAGLVGYGLFALLSRALYASGTLSATAAACVSGWVCVLVADLVLAAALPADQRVLALAVGNSVGMTLLGCALLAVVVRTAGRAAVEGVVPVLAVCAVAGLAAAWLGRQLESHVDSGGPLAALLQGLLVAALSALVYAGIVLLLARAPVTASIRLLRGPAGLGAAPDGAA
ncbi:MAG: murein biosynthesis integral membrane protein MurJ [Nocardioidaceae bacterium]